MAASISLISSEIGRNKDHIDGEVLLRRVADGDHEAFEPLTELVSAPMFAVCFRILRNRTWAEDAAQQAMEELWRSASRYNAMFGSVVAWSTMIARRRAIDLVRRQASAADRERRFAAVHLRPQSDDVAEAVERMWETQYVRSLLAQLSPLQLSAIQLVYYEGMTMTQAAIALGVPVGTLKTRVRGAIARLRREYVEADRQNVAASTRGLLSA